MRSLRVVGFAAIVFAMGCFHPAVTGGVKPALDPGFIQFPTPRDFDPPGTVFRVDSSGVRFDVVDLSSKLPLTNGEETFPFLSSSGRQSFRSNAFLRFLGAVVGIKVGVASDNIFSAEYGLFGAQRQKTTDADIDPALRTALMDIDWRGGDTYYVIRETVSADSIEYSTNDSVAGALDGDATFRSIAGDTSHVTWNRSARYQLTLRFGHPERVFYKLDRLVPETFHLGGGPITKVRYEPVLQPLTYIEKRRQ